MPGDDISHCQGLETYQQIYVPRFNCRCHTYTGPEFAIPITNGEYDCTFVALDINWIYFMSSVKF